MDTADITRLRLAQKEYFLEHQTIPVSSRRSYLKILLDVLDLYEDRILDALYTDLGKSPTEGFMSEVGMVRQEIHYMLKNTRRLARQKYTSTPLHEFPALSETIRIPYGNVLVIAPWNYPFMLSLTPLVDAIAAGNTVILKPSAYAPATSQILAEVVAAAFPPELATVIQGGRAENQALMDEPFDYIFFTGSKAVGHVVMEKAAKNLVPFSLELGGKSPTVVDETANLALSAKRIVFGKFLNAGQTCVAPDYVLVHESVHECFMQALLHEVEKQYGDPATIGKIINQKHFDRLCGLIEPDKVVYGGEAAQNTLQIAPTIMDNVSWDAPVMQEEIFGPVLPVLTYESFEETMAKLQSMPTPLAFYLFSRDKVRQEFIKKVQPFGSGCINDTIVQLTNDHLPFGGMGASGIGQYHGEYGFNTFSHTKAILEKGTLDLPMRYANAPAWQQKLIRLILK